MKNNTVVVGETTFKEMTWERKLLKEMLWGGWKGGGLRESTWLAACLCICLWARASILRRTNSTSRKHFEQTDRGLFRNLAGGGVKSDPNLIAWAAWSVFSCAKDGEAPQKNTVYAQLDNKGWSTHVLVQFQTLKLI